MEDQIDGREDTQRDHLAFVRTVLALERTVLAYLRTALAFLAVGVAVAHFFPGAWLSTWMLGALASLMGAVGIYRAARVALRLRDVRAQLRALDPGSHAKR